MFSKNLKALIYNKCDEDALWFSVIVDSDLQGTLGNIQRYFGLSQQRAYDYHLKGKKA